MKVLSPRGSTEAMKNLVVLFQVGSAGVPQNAAISTNIYERAIEQINDVDSMFNLAELPRRGADAVVPNLERAMRLHERAIKEGELRSMVNLGNILKTCEGMISIGKKTEYAADHFTSKGESRDD